MKNLSVIKQVINKSRHIPVIEKKVLISNDKTIFSLEDFQSFAVLNYPIFDVEDGVYDVFLKIKKDESYEYPDLLEKVEGEKVHVATFTPEDIRLILKVATACSTSKDEYKLTFKGIALDKRGLAIATNAHILLHEKLNTPFNEEAFVGDYEDNIIIPKDSFVKAIKLLGNTNIEVSRIDNYIQLYTDDISVYIDLINQKYVNWEAFIPKKSSYHTSLIFTPELVKQIMAEVKNIKASLSKDAIVNIKIDTQAKKVIYENIDNGIEREWGIDVVPTDEDKIVKEDGILMPVMVQA